MPKKIEIENVGKGDGSSSCPIVYKNNLIFGNGNGYIYCLNNGNGSEKWKFKTGGPIIRKAIINNNSIYIGSGDTHLYKLDLNGKLIWKFKTGGSVSGINAYKNYIIFGSSDNYLYCVNEKGNLLWKFRTGNEVCMDPIIKNDRIYFGSSDNYFYCLNLNGNLLWKFKTGGEISSLDGAEINDKVYFGSADYYIYCLGLNGKFVWKKRTGDIPFSSPVIDNKYLYLAGRDGNFYCLNKNTGKAKWIFKFYAGSLSTPVLDNNSIYFGSAIPRDKLFALDKQGNKLWSFKAENGIATPTLSKNSLYICCVDGHIYCLSKTGEVKWSALKGAGKMTDFFNAIPPLKINPKAFFKRMKEQVERPQPRETNYKKPDIIRDQISEKEYNSTVNEYRSGKLGEYESGTDSLQKYKGEPDGDKRRRKEKEKEEFFLRRERRM